MEIEKNEKISGLPSKILDASRIREDKEEE